MGGGAVQGGLVGAVGFIGQRLGFRGTGADGEDAAQGRVEAIRRSALQGGRRPWGRGARVASPLPPRRASRGRSQRGREIRPDRRVPLGGDQKERWMVAGSAGCVGPKG
jgi:hypothetical protein